MPIVEEVRATASSRGTVASKLVVSGASRDSGQKVHNLIAAVRQMDQRAQVIAFVDTDARPHSEWLRWLVAPLRDEPRGASSSYRWFVPLTHNLASHIRSVWNASIASALGANVEKNFCWGGSTAIRRDTFEAMKVFQTV